MFARFWQGILSESLSEVFAKPIDINSENLDRERLMKRPLRMERMLNAKFVCNEKVKKKQGKVRIEEECGHSWTSNMTAVLFEYKATWRGGIVTITQFGQSCTVCNGNFMSPMYDRESAMGAGGKLKEKILEKFYGVEKRSNASDTFTPKGKKPHESDHCEACRKDACPWGREENETRQRSEHKRNPVKLEMNGIVTYVRWDLHIKGKTLPLGGTNEKLNKAQHAERLKENRAKVKKMDKKSRWNNNASEQKPTESRNKNWSSSQENKHQNKKQTKVGGNITLYCDICEVNCSSIKDMDTHNNGSKHKKSQERLQKDASNSIKPAKVEEQITLDCNICEINCKSIKDMESHINGSKHKKSEERFQKDASNNTESVKVERKMITINCNTIKDLESHIKGSKHKKSEEILQKDDSHSIKPAKVEGKITLDCNICEINCFSIKDMESHINGSKHKKLEERFQKDASNNTESVKVERKMTLYCNTCEINCNTITNLESHIKGLKHKKSIERLKKEASINVDPTKAEGEIPIHCDDVNVIPIPSGEAALVGIDKQLNTETTPASKYIKIRGKSYEKVTFYCIMCKFGTGLFMGKENLEQHVQIYCKECDITFHGFEDLKNHMIVLHEKLTEEQAANLLSNWESGLMSEVEAQEVAVYKDI